MQKRSRNKQGPEDTNEVAFRVISQAIGDTPKEVPVKNAAAVELGRKGGLKGGPARSAKMTAQQRSESAKKAAAARWDKTKQQRAA